MWSVSASVSVLNVGTTNEQDLKSVSGCVRDFLGVSKLRTKVWVLMVIWVSEGLIKIRKNPKKLKKWTCATAFTWLGWCRGGY